MKAAFYTLGCKVNQYESELMSEWLTGAGYDVVGEYDDPDVFIINSCTVTGESDRKTRQAVRKYRKMYPDAVIVLTGCMPQAFPDAAALTDADIVLGNATNHLLVECLDEFMRERRRIIRVMPHKKECVNAAISQFRGRTKAYLKIEDGCDRFCSYCAIPYARGRVRSKREEMIKTEAKALACAGFKEVVLIGINMSAYGKDEGKSLADAVEAVHNAAPGVRIRLGSMEPDQFTDEVIERLAAVEMLMPQFHLSLQSGCDRTLKAMNRHYDAAFYRELVGKIRDKFDNAAITTDVMVGFAGESDEDHNDSVAFVREIGFARAHVFAYSRRDGTAAAKMENQVAESVKRARSKEMLAAAKECADEFILRQLGGVYPVLVESREKDGYLTGYTPNYTRVFIEDTGAARGGEVVDVRLIAAFKDGAMGIVEKG